VEPICGFKSLPDYVIAVGAPAKAIKYNFKNQKMGENIK
jgi:acetyltransferase-like isoleucine patch superfamily enzyme